MGDSTPTDEVVSTHVVNVGKLVCNTSAIELLCMAWLQALSTDKDAVSLLLAERVELPALRKAIKRLARVRQPIFLDRLDAVLKRAEKLAEHRNLVAHNPLMFALGDVPLPIVNLKKAGTPSVARDALPDIINESRLVLTLLNTMYVEAFRAHPSYDNTATSNAPTGEAIPTKTHVGVE
jgi:hypothetical protein